jgi:hypothetical protein
VIPIYCGNWTIDDIGKEEEILLSSLADGQDMSLRDTVGIYKTGAAMLSRDLPVAAIPCVTASAR